MRWMWSDPLPMRRQVAILGVASLLWFSPPPQAAGQIPGGAAASGIRLIVKEGEGAIHNVRSPRAKEPVVVVVDASDKPIAGASVTFLLPELGPSALFPTGSSLTAVTGPDGTIVGRGLRPNNVVGPYQIRVVASYMGQTVRAIINQTNANPQKSAGGGGGKTALILALIGGAGAAVALGLTQSGGDSPTPNQPPPNPGTSISVGGSTFGPPN